MIIESILLFLTVFIVIAGCLHAQKKHYEFIKSQKHQKNLCQLNDEVMAKMQQCDETKKRVDNLIIRAGFKV